jgi:hypothetical protein
VPRGHRALEQRGSVLVTSLAVDEVHPGGRFEHLWNMGNLSGNFTESGTHLRSVVAAGWREAVGATAFEFDSKSKFRRVQFKFKFFQTLTDPKRTFQGSEILK